MSSKTKRSEFFIQSLIPAALVAVGSSITLVLFSILLRWNHDEVLIWIYLGLIGAVSIASELVNKPKLQNFLKYLSKVLIFPWIQILLFIFLFDDSSIIDANLNGSVKEFVNYSLILIFYGFFILGATIVGDDFFDVMRLGQNETERWTIVNSFIFSSILAVVWIILISLRWSLPEVVEDNRVLIECVQQDDELIDCKMLE